MIVYEQLHAGHWLCVTTIATLVAIICIVLPILWIYALEYKKKSNNDLTIKVKYLEDIEQLKVITIGDWIDMRSAEDVELEPFEYYNLRLGVAMELPTGYEAYIAARSSTYKNFGVLMASGIGIIDNKYCGDNDEWHFPCIALRKTVIHKGDRICQFRVIKSMNKHCDITLETVDHLGNADRGGLGSTGTK